MRRKKEVIEQDVRTIVENLDIAVIIAIAALTIVLSTGHLEQGAYISLMKYLIGYITGSAAAKQGITYVSAK